MANPLNPAIQEAPLPIAAETNYDEKNIASVGVSPSVHVQPALRGWLAGLQSKIRLRNRRNQHGSPPISQPRGAQPSEPNSIKARVWKFFRFLGPGAIITVAYVDPDNYQTAIASGGSFEYKLLFMVLVSNVIAMYIQSLCVKLGTVTGQDLAQLNHRHLPRRLELAIYVVAEASIIATDLGQVIGTAIALNILIPKLPLPASCVISVVETLLILLFYTNTGELRRVRLFEVLIAILVAAVFVTLCVGLSMISTSARDVLRGFVPSTKVFVDTGLYEMCAILGGTLMPHALYVGTSLSRTRLYDYDAKHNLAPRESPDASTDTLSSYRPSLRAIKSCLNYSIAELCVTLFTVAVFVNSALVIISGAAFYKGGGGGDDGDGSGEGEVSSDLYDLYDLFSETISPVAGVLFAVSLLFSGVSAGIVSTMAGQILMEGAFNIRVSPFLRRLMTRCVAIIPALVIAVAVGQDGLSRALVACNYLLAIALIPITFPLIWYTCLSKYMLVPSDDGTGMVSMENSLPTAGIAWILWLLVVVMDVATVVLVGLGITKDDG
ncbi:natural resistance-associated macrophage protein-domain-containing protein [Lasiosphaeria hispida]|uniref:Natural resistance-associated macrophage protein-domain-containing protein n=1 Tax=Lasiosphaeria hispida TaxID=260671 RepID=A0AAJ0H8V6_9PEZI|nr:natural resistance-associated macrophage protein-domain-containing protein [Lasiosphaeria hispida]